MVDYKHRNPADPTYQNLVLQIRPLANRRSGNEEAFQSYLLEEFQNKNGAICTALGMLPEADRLTLINAVIQGDTQQVQALFAQYHLVRVFKNQTTFNSDRINNFLPTPPGNLNNFSAALINTLLEMPAVNSNQDYWHSVIWLEQVLRSIPDEIISRDNKLTLAATIDPRMIEPIQYVKYTVDPPTLATVQAFQITIEQYKAAMQNFDESDFIILSLELLKTQENFRNNMNSPRLQKALDILYKNYFNLDFETCIKQINNMAVAFASNEIQTLFNNVSKNVNATHPEISLGPRVFQTRMAQLGLDGNSPENFENIRLAIQLIADHFKMNVKVNNATDIINIITIIDSVNTNIDDLSEKLKDQSTDMEQRVPRLKSWITCDNHLNILDNLYSPHLGLVTKNAPILDAPTSPYPSNQGAVNKYVPDFNHPLSNQGPFVKGLSGHGFSIIAAIVIYLNNADENPQLNHEKVAELFIKAATFSYVMRGYHSFHEILDVFKQPGVEQLFKPGFLKQFKFNSDLIKNAMKESAGYSLAVCLNHATVESILATVAKIDKTPGSGPTQTLTNNNNRGSRNN